jgi:uncharacterized protein
MMLGVMSDTHGNVALMHQIADRMVTDFGVDTILHLGDDYRDAEQLEMAGHDVRIVPGLWCDEYHSPRVSKWLEERFDGVRIAGCHADKDLRARDRAADIVLTGHTHQATIERIGHTLYVNPGHLKRARDRGERPSFALIDIGDATITVKIVEVDGTVRREESFPRG